MRCDCTASKLRQEHKPRDVKNSKYPDNFQIGTIVNKCESRRVKTDVGKIKVEAIP